jgi:hypothetical protein
MHLLFFNWGNQGLGTFDPFILEERTQSVLYFEKKILTSKFPSFERGSGQLL